MRAPAAAALLLAASLAAAQSDKVVGVYRGTLPCADCAGIDTELTIRASSPTRLAEARFWMKETRRGGKDDGATFESGGALLVLRGAAGDPDATVYELREARSRTSRFFLRVSDDELRPLDAELRAGDSKHKASLKRVEDPK